MTSICPICGNNITEGDYSCPNCGAIIKQQGSTSIEPTYGGAPTQHTQPMGYPSKAMPRKSNKMLITAIAIALIAIVAIIVIIFFILPQGDPSDFVGTWDATGFGTSSQVWAFYEDGTVKMASTFEPQMIPSVSFVRDDISDTLTVASVGTGSYSSSAQSGTYKIEGGKLCITASGMTVCFNYDISNNGNTVTLTGVYQFTLTKTSSVPTIPDTQDGYDDLKWEDLEITGDCDTSDLGTYIYAGDQIKSCSGTITVIYISTNTLLGTWDFT